MTSHNSPKKMKSVPHPTISILEAFELAQKITRLPNFDVAKPIPKLDLIELLGRGKTTMTQPFATMGYYSIFTDNSGDCLLSAKYKSFYKQPTYFDQPLLIQMFLNVPIYQKIVTQYVYTPLPDESKFCDVLVGQYKIGHKPSVKAAKVFFQNIRHLRVFNEETKMLDCRATVEKTDKKRAETRHITTGEEDTFYKTHIPITFLSEKKETKLIYIPEETTSEDIELMKIALDGRKKELLHLQTLSDKQVVNIPGQFQ